MPRIFISLYLLIVFSIVFAGLGMDKLWQYYNPEPDVDYFEVAFFKTIDQQISDMGHDTDVRTMETVLPKNVYLLPMSDFANSSVEKRFSTGQIVSVLNADEGRSSYYKISNKPYVLRIDSPMAHHQNKALYIGLLVAFYSVIALIIYFWVWPLSRDLKRLQTQTQFVGKQGQRQKVDIGHKSAVYPLASAFNAMADRINELISSHKEITSAVSHELRTPLARMKFALEMVDEINSDPSIREHIQGLKHDVEDMNRLINDLLSYASYEQTDQNLVIDEGDIQELISSVLNALLTDKIDFTIENKLAGAPVFCDWVLMERCLHNLIQNAAKYAKSEIFIQLSIVGEHYCISIEDDGLGIDKKDRGRIFNAYVRLREKDKSKQSGFGLGLAIVKRIAKWHQGQVYVESSSLGGAKFVLLWPTKTDQ